MIRKNLLGLASLAAMLLAAPAHADILDGNVGDKSFRFSLYGAMPEWVSLPTAQYDVGTIIRPEKDEDLLQIYAGAVITGEYGWSDVWKFAAGYGARAIYVGQDHDSGGALALGGMFEARFPDVKELGISAYVYGAPKALTLGEVEEYLEYAASVDYKITDGFALYVGYRYVRYDIGSRQDLVADNGLHGGFRYWF